MEKALVDALIKRSLHISFAESCTGGLMAKTITDVPGASSVFECGFVTYSNRIKESVLGVQAEIIEKHTEVSFECASAMAERAAALSGAEVALSSTGFAGPGGGNGKDGVGTVYIGLYCLGKISSYRFVFAGNRDEVRQAAVKKAFEIALNAVI